MPVPAEVVKKLMEPSPEVRPADELLSLEEQEAVRFYIEQLSLTLLSSAEINELVAGLTRPAALDLLKTVNVGSADLILLLEEKNAPAGGDQEYGWRRTTGSQNKPSYIVNQSAGLRQKGGMGFVWTAFDLHMHRRVALKVVNPQIGLDEFREKLKLEGRAQARVSKAHILPIYSLIDTEDGPALVMRYMDEETNPTLRRVLSGDRTTPGSTNYDNPITAERLNDRPIFAPDRVIRFVEHMASGLVAMHDLGMYHLDLKPGNIFMSLDDDPNGDIIGDFGLSNLVQNPSDTVGTPRYMSPEQVFGEPVDERSDIFSLSLILYEMVTGGTLIKGDNPMVQQMKVANLHGSLDDLPNDPLLNAYCQKYGLEIAHVAGFFKLGLAKKDQRITNMTDFVEWVRYAFTPAQSA